MNLRAACSPPSRMGRWSFARCAWMCILKRTWGKILKLLKLASRGALRLGFRLRRGWLLRLFSKGRSKTGSGPGSHPRILRRRRIATYLWWNADATKEVELWTGPHRGNEVSPCSPTRQKSPELEQIAPKPSPTKSGPQTSPEIAQKEALNDGPENSRYRTSGTVCHPAPWM